MTIEGQKVKVGVNIRPYVMTFLKRMAKKYEIVIFTASHEAYANAILDELDPEK
jgi:CTD small phosphatase-like protein 2